MKKLLYFICLLLSINLAYSQNCTLYSFEFQEKIGLTCDLNIYKDGMYKIKLFYEISDDIVYLVELSYGNYIIKKNDIYLYDHYNKYQMHFLIYNEEIIPLTGFKILVNRSFLKIKNYGAPNAQFKKKNFISIKKSISNFNIKNKCYNKLEYGTYGIDNGLKLIFFKNHNYQFKYDNIDISVGKWERNGNELICHDSNLQHKFYLSIGDKFIVNRFLPTGLDDFKLYIKK